MSFRARVFKQSNRWWLSYRGFLYSYDTWADAVEDIKHVRPRIDNSARGWVVQQRPMW